VTARDGDNEVHWLDHTRHHSRYVFKPNIAIGMAWGMPREPGEGFHEDWVTRFPDEKAHAAWLDLLYHGQPVDRRMYVGVDGDRCKIPLPEQTFADDPMGREVRRWIPYEPYRLFAIVNALESSRDYERYLDQTGLDVSREP
jgi:hypothetical protein